MKKLKIMLIALLSLALIFSLCSCDIIKGIIGGGDCEHIDEDKDGICDKCEEKMPATPSGEGVLLIDNGTLNFQIVCGHDTPISTRMYLDKLIEQLEEDFDIELKIAEDKAATAQDCEVLIGTVSSRGEDYKYDKYSLGAKGYTIQAKDQKIIITGGSEETIDKAVREFFEDILGINEDTDEIGTVEFNDATTVHKPQDDYRIKDVTVGGQSIKSYKIVVDSSVNPKFNTPFRTAATELQNFLYSQVGIYLDVVDIGSYDKSEDGDAIIFRGVATGKAGSKGFRTRVDGKTLVIECAHHNMFAEAFSSYYNKNLAFARNETLQLKNADSEIDITKVYYSDFGAVGDGETDDYAAIKAAHDFANDGGQKVYADKGKTYYLANIKSEISVKTNVDWNGATIIVDDSHVTTNGNTGVSGVTGLIRDNGFMTLDQDVADIKATAAQIAAVNALKGDGELTLIGLESKSGETTQNIGFALGYPAMLTIYNANHKNYLRYGYVDTQGSSQHEIVLVDKDGNIDPSTPLLHDYEEVTSIVIHRADTTPLTIENGTIHHIASRVNLLGGYYSIGRGINISRANVTLRNIKHEISGEIAKNQPVRRDADGLAVVAEGYTYSNGKIIGPDGSTYIGDDIKPFTGHSYGGLVSIRNTHNTYINKVTFQARVYYEEGTYDIGAGNSNKLIFDECDQSNFYEEDGTTVNMSKCWGVAGTNYCKNMEYLNCKLTRYDAHSGVTNGKIIGGELAVLRLIGGGDFIMEGVKIITRNSGAPLQLRSDYGASFNGTLTIRNCTIQGKINSLISAPTSYWDMGYETFFPNIVIDNLNMESASKDGKILLISDTASGYQSFSASNLYPQRELFRVDPNDPNTAGYQFSYVTKDPEAWIAENITAEGAKFEGCTEDNYEVHDLGGGTYSVVITDIKNRFLYHAPDFIKILNNSDKDYELVLYQGDFFKNTTIEFERGTLTLVPKRNIPAN